MSKGTDEFQRKIKEYLDGFAKTDEVFAGQYANPQKNIEQCCDFIIGQVQKSGRCGFADEEIYGMAIHYYQEENVGDIKKLNCSVVINEEVKLSEEDIQKAKEAAKKRIEQEEVDRIKAEEKKAREKAQKKAEEQREKEKSSGMLSLFDLLEQ